MSDRLADRRRLASLVAVVVGIALLVVSLVRISGDGGGDRLRLESDIAATATVTPRIHRFGDSLRARVTVVLDRRRLDPGLVRLETDFEPYRAVGATRVEREDVGDVTRLRYTVTLRCLVAGCLPRARERRQFEFPRSTVVYRRAATFGSQAEFVHVAWPPVEVVSHLSEQALEAARAADPRGRGDAPTGLTDADLVLLWRANPLDLPPVSYRVRPTVLAASLLTLALALALAGGALLWRQLPRPAPEAAAAPVEEDVPPIERALRVVDLALANGNVREQRRALELLARQLAREDEPSLAAEARALAWSESAPAREAATALGERVRSTLNGRRDGEHA